MSEYSPWKKRFERERAARKESEKILESKSSEIYELNKNLEKLVYKRTLELEEALQKANIANVSKANFLANMSHEIRTPMNGILGFTELIAKGDLNKSQREYINIVNSSTKTLLSIINNILDYSKNESEKVNIELIKVEPFMELKNCFMLYDSMAKAKNINYRFNIDKNIHHYLYMDIYKVHQVISNLITNAIKFTDVDKDVEVNIEVKSDEDSSQVLRFSVKDQGIGIAPENIDKIFEPFTQADDSTTRKFGGTGLGLSITSSFVNAMGGKLKVESELNQGSVFFFELEFEKCNDESNHTSENKSINKVISEKINKKAKVLIVDDYEFNQILAGEILKSFGIEFDICDDGEKAVEFALKNNYDAILMDVNMPILNGLNATRILKNTHHLKTPIIALTANAIAGDKEKFLQAGMDDYISKPIEIDILVKVLGKYIPINEI